MTLAEMRSTIQRWDDTIEMYNRRIERQRWMHEHDEQLMGGFRPRCNPIIAEKRGIERMVVNYIECAGKAHNLPASLTKSLCQCALENVQHMYDRDEDQSPVSGTQWFKEARRDIMENFLYQEFVEQLSSPKPIRTFSAYAMFVAVKGVINLLTEHKDGVEALRSISPVGELFPSREDAIAFKNTISYDDTNPVWFLAGALLIPGIWEAAQTLQIHYGELARFYRTEEDGTQLPDYQFEIGMEVTEDTLIEVAVQAYLAEEGSADDIAAEYGIGQKRFRKELRSRGIMISHGGDRKKGN